MALINCKECGKQVSDKAKICPHCGAHLIEERAIEENMERKIKLCEECGAEIPADSRMCPVCGYEPEDEEADAVQRTESTEGEKKTKIWPIIIGIIVIVIVAFFIFGGGGDKPSGTQDNPAQTEADAGNHIDSTEAGSPISKYTQLQEALAESDLAFSMNEDAVSFITEHPDFFPGSSKNEGAMGDCLDYEVDYQHIAKNPSKYSKELMYVGGTVVDCEENETDDGTITFLQITDESGYNYCLYYLGTLENVFEQEEVWGYALPFGMVTFENMGGNYTEAVVGAATYIYTYADAL